MKATKRTTVIADFLIPYTPEAVLMYKQNDGRLNREGEFGQDPLVTRSDLCESRTMRIQRISLIRIQRISLVIQQTWFCLQTKETI